MQRLLEKGEDLTKYLYGTDKGAEGQGCASKRCPEPLLFGSEHKSVYVVDPSSNQRGTPVCFMTLLAQSVLCARWLCSD